MPGAEVVHTFVATMRPVGAIRLLERRDSVWQGRGLTRCRISAATDRGACRTRTLRNAKARHKGGP